MAEIVTVMDEGLGNSSYVVDIGDRRALVLDPERDPGRYLAAAAARGLRPAYTAETHLHADFVSGSRELAARGAQVVAPDEDAFVNLLLDGLGTYPRYFLRLREVNRLGPAVHGTPPPPLAPLSVDRVRRLVGDGAQLVDARPAAAFSAGHIAGAVSITLRPAFASWLGWLADPDRPLVFVLDDDQDRGELVRQALNVGYERLAGELAGGMHAWQAAGRPAATIPLVDATGLDPARTIDVRQAAEFAAGHVPGTRNIELGALADLGTAVPRGSLTLACGPGERAMTAASLLSAAGRHDLSVLDGGLDDWARVTGRPLGR